jgi:Ca2+-binding EF-hand superfamily protein
VTPAKQAEVDGGSKRATTKERALREEVNDWHEKRPAKLSEEERGLQVTLNQLKLERVKFDRRVEEQVLRHSFVKGIQEVDRKGHLEASERAELASVILEMVSKKRRRFWDMCTCFWESQLARRALKLHCNWHMTQLFKLVTILLCSFVIIEPPRTWAAAPGLGPYNDSSKAGFAALEFLLVLILNLDFVLMLLYRGFDDLCHKSTLSTLHRFNLLVNILLTADAFANLLVQGGALGPDVYYLRWGRPLRPLYFLFLFATLRDAAVSCVQSINSLFDLGVLTLVFLTFSALVGVVLFGDQGPDGVEETLTADGWLVQHSDGFETVEQAFLTLFVLLTYDNFLRVMSITQSAGTGCVMFVVVYVVVTFVIMGVVVAIVYEYYKDARSVQVISMKLQERRLLLGAFTMADENGNGILDLQEFMGMLGRMDLSGMDSVDTKAVFHKLDVDRSGTVTKSEFLDLCDVLLLKHYELELIGNQVFGHARPWSSNLEWLIETRWFERFSLFITVAFCSMIIMEASTLGDPTNSSTEDEAGDMALPPDADWSAAYHAINRVFLALFTLEMLIKIGGMSLQRYLVERWNRFDSVLVLLGWAALIASESADQTSNDNSAGSQGILLLRVVRLAQLVRVSRLISVLHHVKRLRALVKTFYSSVVMLFELSGLVIVLWYFYAVLGCEMFYGLLSEANDEEKQFVGQVLAIALAPNRTVDSNGMITINASLVAQLQGQQNSYITVQACSIWCEDFDGFFSASLVLFQVLTSAGWSNVMYRSMEVYGIGAQTYWTSYTLFIAIIVLNLVSALLLDLYSMQLQREASMQEEKNELLQSIVDAVEDEDEEGDEKALRILGEDGGSAEERKKLKRRRKMARQVESMKLLSTGIRGVFDMYSEPLNIEAAMRITSNGGSSRSPVSRSRASSEQASRSGNGSVRRSIGDVKRRNSTNQAQVVNVAASSNIDSHVKSSNFAEAKKRSLAKLSTNGKGGENREVSPRCSPGGTKKSPYLSPRMLGRKISNTGRHLQRELSNTSRQIKAGAKRVSTRVSMLTKSNSRNKGLLGLRASYRDEPDVELVLPANRFSDFLTNIGCTSEVVDDVLIEQIKQSLVCRDEDEEIGPFMRFGEFIEWYRHHGVAFLFHRFDDDGNGVLTAEEMPQLLRCIGIKVNDRQVQDVLKLLDCDSSGGISLDELQQWWTVFDAQRAFEVHDLSHDGAIDHRELRLLARELGVDMTLEEARAAVAALDVDHDSSLSYEEFLPWWMAFLVKNKQNKKRHISSGADRVTQLKLRTEGLKDVQQMEELLNQILEDEAKSADEDLMKKRKQRTSVGFHLEHMLSKIEKVAAQKKTEQQLGKEEKSEDEKPFTRHDFRGRALSKEDGESLRTIRRQLSGAGIGLGLDGLGLDGVHAAASTLFAATASDSTSEHTPHEDTNAENASETLDQATEDQATEGNTEGSTEVRGAADVIQPGPRGGPAMLDLDEYAARGDEYAARGQ